MVDLHSMWLFYESVVKFRHKELSGMIEVKKIGTDLVLWYNKTTILFTFFSLKELEK